MPTGEEWLLRPVAQGMCKYESLLDGSINLGDLAAMNDYIDVQSENDWRVQEANE